MNGKGNPRFRNRGLTIKFTSCLSVFKITAGAAKITTAAEDKDDNNDPPPPEKATIPGIHTSKTPLYRCLFFYTYYGER